MFGINAIEDERGNKFTFADVPDPNESENIEEWMDALKEFGDLQIIEVKKEIFESLLGEVSSIKFNGEKFSDAVKRIFSSGAMKLMQNSTPDTAQKIEKMVDIAECFELVYKAYKVVKVELSDAEPEEVLEKVVEFTEALEEWEKAVVGFQW